MKKYYLFIALAMVAAMTVSCKNNNKKAAKTAEANAEVVEAAKTILADDVLATLDGFARVYTDADDVFSVPNIIAENLTEEEKLVKPDYLLDPGQVANLVTKSQKINALAILFPEKTIRAAYGMPTQEVDEAIARLAAELNHPINLDDYKNLPLSEVVKKDYAQLKERGELAYFWQFSFACQTEMAYLISQNPDSFLRNITEEQYQSYNNRFLSCIDAVKELAKYDEEIAAEYKIFNDNKTEEGKGDFSTLENAKRTFSTKTEIFAANRAALLK